MPRTKKIQTSEEVLQLDPGIPYEISKPAITSIALDFNREDLNALRDKVNEVINYINNA